MTSGGMGWAGSPSADILSDRVFPPLPFFLFARFQISRLISSILLDLVQSRGLW
jgi:hypothetical protein